MKLSVLGLWSGQRGSDALPLVGASRVGALAEGTKPADVHAPERSAARRESPVGAAGAPRTAARSAAAY